MLATDQNPRKKRDPGNRLYSIKIILPWGLDSIRPRRRGRKLSALVMTFEIENALSETLPLKNVATCFSEKLGSRKFTFLVTDAILRVISVEANVDTSTSLCVGNQFTLA